MTSFESHGDLNAAALDLAALRERQQELNTAIASVLHHLVPGKDRRRREHRRSGLDRRDRRGALDYFPVDELRRKSDRRRGDDRRLPPGERLWLLRVELNEVIQRQPALTGLTQKSQLSHGNTVKTIASWTEVTQGQELGTSLFGTVYDVPGLGKVWVGPHDVSDAVAFGGEALCLLVTKDEDPAERLWAIVEFRSRQDPEPFLHGDSFTEGATHG